MWDALPCVSVWGLNERHPWKGGVSDGYEGPGTAQQPPVAGTFTLVSQRMKAGLREVTDPRSPLWSLDESGLATYNENSASPMPFLTNFFPGEEMACTSLSYSRKFVNFAFQNDTLPL